MLLVIPSIELKNGKCTVCIRGEDGSEAIYEKMASNPMELCRLLRRENSKTIHFSDMDSLHNNSTDNFPKIVEYAKAVDIPIQVKARFESADDCRYLLDNGVYRVIICNLAFSQPDKVRELISEYLPSRIAFCLNSDKGKVYIPFLAKTIDDREYIQYIKGLGADRIMYHDSSWDEPDAYPDIEDLKRLTKNLEIKVTLANGIKKVEQLWELNNALSEKGTTVHTVDSIIIGKPLFENLFPCQKIWRLIESKLEQS